MTPATLEMTHAREPELLGQTVLVIGGSAGIGLETARRARAEGADVILTARDPDRLKRAAAHPDFVRPGTRATSRTSMGGTNGREQARRGRDR